MAIETADKAKIPPLTECIPPRSMFKKIGDSIITTVLSENRFNPLSHFSKERRRDGWGKIIPWFFPASFIYGEKPPGLIRAEELVDDGYGLIIACRHFSKRDFLMFTAFLHANSTVDRGREFYTALAFQEYTPGATRLLRYHGVTPKPIVIDDTVNIRKNFDTHGNERPLGEGTRGFVLGARTVLNKGGIVCLAPSAKRTLLHKPWDTNSIEMLLKVTKDKVAVISVGYDIRIGTITNYKKFQGYNLWLEYVVDCSNTNTKQELENKARQQDISVDRLVADDMATLSRPDFLGKEYDYLKV